MGTSSITRVIENGEKRINLFCQWDGDPTSRGSNVLKFMRNTLLNGECDKLRSALQKVTLVNRSETDPELAESTYTGAPFTADGATTFLRVEYFSLEQKNGTYTDRVSLFLDQGKITQEEAQYALAAHIGVGNDILPYRLKHNSEEITLYTHDAINGLPDEIDAGIQSVFTVDMDNETVEIWWNGQTDTFPFKELMACQEEDIDERMDALELPYYEGVSEKFDDSLLP